MLRFVRNCRSKQKQRGPLTTPEVDEMKTWWIKRVQLQDSTTPHHEPTKVARNLQKNVEGLLECRGRIRGKYPTYLPPDAPFTRKLVQRVHVETLHGGVGLTMAAVRVDYWIPKLRRLVKSIRRDCWGCKRSKATAFAAPLLVNFQKTEPPKKQPSKSWELILQGQYGIEELRSERERPIWSFSLAVCRERST